MTGMTTGISGGCRTCDLAAASVIVLAWQVPQNKSRGRPLGNSTIASLESLKLLTSVSLDTKKLVLIQTNMGNGMDPIKVSFDEAVANCIRRLRLTWLVGVTMFEAMDLSSWPWTDVPQLVAGPFIPEGLQLKMRS